MGVWITLERSHAHRSVAQRLLEGALAEIVETLALEVVRYSAFRMDFMPGNLPRLMGVLLLWSLAVTGCWLTRPSALRCRLLSISWLRVPRTAASTLIRLRLRRPARRRERDTRGQPRRLLPVLVALTMSPVMTSRPSYAQQAPASSHPSFETEWSLLAGGASNISLHGSKTGREFGMLSLMWGRQVTRSHGPGLLRGRLELSVEVTPVFVMDQERQSTYGFGVAPVFLRWNFTNGRHLQPFVEFAGGLLRTDHEVPEGTTRLNFTAQAGLGVRFPLRNRRALLLGYRFHHISNGDRVSTNPSVNSTLFYAGLSLLR